MLKNDKWIAEMAAKGMIDPFAERGVRRGTISFGLSSYGYDMRLWDEFRLFTPGEMAALDPKEVPPESFTPFKGEVCLLSPGSFVLGRSLEYFRIPRDVIVLSTGKSTYARCGVVVNVTPLEPEWEGFVTIAISNTGPLPVKLYANEGISQLVFLGAKDLCQISYVDKSGKYQAQKGITLSRL
jgi:dCTP deaminase